MVVSRVAHEYGGRTYLLGRRVHHGSAGLLFAAGTATAAAYMPKKSRRKKALLGGTALGVGAATADRHDFPWRDRDNHFRPGKGGVKSDLVESAAHGAVVTGAVYGANRAYKGWEKKNYYWRVRNGKRYRVKKGKRAKRVR